jgi:hypothetical protein
LAPANGILHRSRSKTQLKFTNSGQYAENPETAPYYLHGIQASSDVKAALRRGAPEVHIAFLDLTKTARTRLGPDWRPFATRFLEALKAVRADVPVVAVTDDPWVHRELMWKILKSHANVQGKRPARNSAIFTPGNSISGIRQPSTPDLQGCAKIQAVGFAGRVDVTIDVIEELKHQANRLEDTAAQMALTELGAVLKRSANLPGGVVDLGNYVANEAGQSAAINIMQAYQAPRVISRIQQLEGALAQSRRQALADVCRAARTDWENQSLKSPMSILLKEALKPYLHSSSKVLVLLRNSMICDYATSALTRDPESGAGVAARIEKKMFLFRDEIGFRETTGLPERERRQIKTLIHVCPTRGSLLSNLTLPWLPDRQIILADARTLAAVARDASQIAEYPSFSAFAARLKSVALVCQEAADGVYGKHVVLGEGEPPPADIDFPTSKVVDLSGSGTSSTEPLLKIETENRQIVIARLRTKLLVYDEDSAVPTYRANRARDVEVGQSICVISDDFIDMARKHLDIVYTANQEIREYHLLVMTLFSAICGSSEREKRVWLAARINQLRNDQSEREVNDQNVRYWVDLSNQVELPLEEVTPCAPQDYSTFRRFARALGIADVSADRYWKWAVIATRSNRLKAAHRFHEAYVGILTSPFSAESENPQRAKDIRALRAAAERFVSKILSITTIRRADLCK